MFAFDMPNRLHHDSLLRSVGRALSAADRNGLPVAQRTSLVRFEHHAEGNCQSPVTIELYARPGGKLRRVRASQLRMLGFDEKTAATHVTERQVRVAKGTKHPVWLTRHTRCRECANCQQAHAAYWVTRCAPEVTQSVRSWFGTLTFSEEALYKAKCRAVLRLSRGGTDYDALSERVRFSELLVECNKELTKYLKRVRKQTGARLRFIAVAELGEQTQRLHFHMLLHECEVMSGNMKNDVLQPQWADFTVWRLAYPRWWSKRERRWIDATPTQAAWYVCKYITKSPMARVRASVRYGKQSQAAPARVGLALPEGDPCGARVGDASSREGRGPGTP